MNHESLTADMHTMETDTEIGTDLAQTARRFAEYLMPPILFVGDWGPVYRSVAKRYPWVQQVDKLPRNPARLRAPAPRLIIHPTTNRLGSVQAYLAHPEIRCALLVALQKGEGVPKRLQSLLQGTCTLFLHNAKPRALLSHIKGLLLLNRSVLSLFDDAVSITALSTSYRRAYGGLRAAAAGGQAVMLSIDDVNHARVMLLTATRFTRFRDVIIWPESAQSARDRKEAADMVKGTQAVLIPFRTRGAERIASQLIRRPAQRRPLVVLLQLPGDKKPHFEGLASIKVPRLTSRPVDALLTAYAVAVLESHTDSSARFPNDDFVLRVIKRRGVTLSGFCETIRQHIKTKDAVSVPPGFSASGFSGYTLDNLLVALESLTLNHIMGTERNTVLATSITGMPRTTLIYRLSDKYKQRAGELLSHE